MVFGNAGNNCEEINSNSSMSALQAEEEVQSVSNEVRIHTYVHTCNCM